MFCAFPGLDLLQVRLDSQAPSLNKRCPLEEGGSLLDSSWNGHSKPRRLSLFPWEGMIIQESLRDREILFSPKTGFKNTMAGDHWHGGPGHSLVRSHGAMQR